VNTWKVILATMVIFAAGVVTGGLLVRNVESHYSVHRRPGAVRATQPSSPGGMRLEFLRRAQRELGLTSEQKQRIDAILKESQDRTRNKIREELQRTRTEFREVLTPEQRVQFEELIKRPPRSREQRRTAPPPS